MGETPTYGSIIMFDCPDFMPPSCLDESVFAAFDFSMVMDIANVSSPSLSMMQAAEEYARRGVQKLVDWCQMRKVDVEFVCSTIEASIDFVASKRPWTMSWSNISDYMLYDKFHDLARSCSRHEDTIHFGYSMNWTGGVHGTCLIDFAGPKCVEIRRQILVGSNEAMAES